MKKLCLLVLLAGIFLTGSFAEGVGTCTQTNQNYFDGYRVIEVVCIADAGAATYPSTTVVIPSPGYLYAIEVDPDNTATPQDNYDFTLVNSRGANLIGTQGTNMDTTSTASVYIPLTTYVFVDTDMTLAVSGNNVNSAKTTLYFHFVR